MKRSGSSQLELFVLRHLSSCEITQEDKRTEGKGKNGTDFIGGRFSTLACPMRIPLTTKFNGGISNMDSGKEDE